MPLRHQTQDQLSLPWLEVHSDNLERYLYLASERSSPQRIARAHIPRYLSNLEAQFWLTSLLVQYPRHLVRCT